MDDEDAFLRAILAEPSDPARRLVYADWLEERGDHQSLRRAEYLRVECALDALAPGDENRVRLTARLEALREGISGDWWRTLDWTEVHFCVAFQYRCPRRWDELRVTDDAKTRFCDECREPVHYCRDDVEAQSRAARGECVAIDSRAFRFPRSALQSKLSEPFGLLGKVRLVTPRRVPLPTRGAPAEPVEDDD